MFKLVIPHFLPRHSLGGVLFRTIKLKNMNSLWNTYIYILMSFSSLIVIVMVKIIVMKVLRFYLNYVSTCAFKNSIYIRSVTIWDSSWTHHLPHYNHIINNSGRNISAKTLFKVICRKRYYSQVFRICRLAFPFYKKPCFINDYEYALLGYVSFLWRQFISSKLNTHNIF